MQNRSQQPGVLVPCRAELASIETDWGAVWRRVRLPCLGSEASSHMFKLIHGLLLCESKLAEIIPNSSPICKHQCPGDPVAVTIHCYFSCRLTSTVGIWLLSVARQYDSSSTQSHLLRISFKLVLNYCVQALFCVVLLILDPWSGTTSCMSGDQPISLSLWWGCYILGIHPCPDCP